MTSADRALASFEFRSLKLIWRSEPHTERLIVGTLWEVPGGMAFAYDGEDVERARALGFTGYGALSEGTAPDPTTALAMFTARLPSRSRPDYGHILEQWGLLPSGADPLLILAATGGKLPTDLYEFIPDVKPRGGTRIYTDIAGFRFQASGDQLWKLEPGTTLDLVPDDRNEFDAKAVEVLLGGERVGFIKKVLSGSVKEWLDEGHKVRCTLDRIKANGKLNEVVVRLDYE